MTDKEFLKYLHGQIPTQHRECADADHTYKSLRWLIEKQLWEPEVKDYAKRRS